MSPQTNATRFQGGQQSRIIYSTASSLLLHNAQQYIVAPTTNPGASKRPAQMYFEEHGLRVPLLKLGQRRPHARSAADLASKSKQSLTVIVKAYAESKASKLLKTLVSKTALAEWIEGAETLTSGPHPESRLPSTKKGDLVEALGLKSPTQKAKNDKAGRSSPTQKTTQKKRNSQSEETLTMQQDLHSSSRVANSEATQKVTLVESTTNSTREAHKAHKRKCDSAPVTTEAEQTPAKKQKTSDTSSSTSSSPQMCVAVSTEASVRGEATLAPVLAPEEADQNQATPTETNNLVFVNVPGDYGKDVGSDCEPHREPFLKPGRHGRNGDFADDPDLLTGHGHQVNPSDLKQRREYEAKYRAFHATWPFWPFLDREGKYPAPVHNKEKKELDEAEQGMKEYREKYHGELNGIKRNYTLISTFKSDVSHTVLAAVGLALAAKHALITIHNPASVIASVPEQVPPPTFALNLVNGASKPRTVVSWQVLGYASPRIPSFFRHPLHLDQLTRAMALLTSLVGLLAIPLTYAAPQAQSQSPSSASGVTTTASVSASSVAASSSPTASLDPLTTEETEALFQLHEDLINISSISDDEIECAEWLEEYLEEKEYYVERVPVTAGAEGRFNVFAYPQAIRDNGSWPEVLVSSHIDTVPPFIPFETREENGTTYHFGRGSVDAKAAIATMIIATEKFLASRDDTPSVGLLFVVGEETGGDGMLAFAEYASNTTFRAGIFGEPTEGKLATGHKGVLGLTLNITGRSAHSAYPQLGLSAINYLSEAIVAINSLEPALPRSDLLGPSTLNVGVIRGGLANNVVAPNATAGVSIRIARSENGSVEVVRDMIAGMLAPIIQEVEERNGTFNATFSNAYYPAQILDTGVPGLEEAPVFYGTDIPSLPQVELRYLYGAGTIEVAHTPNEQLSQDELVQGAEAYGLILRHLFPDN
ncbi:hypothetical protein OPT61_g7560 [Boeremia exigua]|uniref:Uncharacterized protein n=1 Tax=Boeremia exigua TaxID=749465 RepID=A0ACC2I1R6_9PLEO|nr:hypothetical protein OPT61_g7560 [Boeremia exigua]